MATTSTDNKPYKATINKLIEGLKYEKSKDECAKALAKIGDNRAIVPLIECLSDCINKKSGSISSVISALSSFRDSRAINVLMRCLDIGSPMRPRMMAAFALGLIGEDAVKPLIKYLNRPVSQSRFAAGDVIHALMIIAKDTGNSEAMEAIISELSSVGTPSAVAEKAIYSIGAPMIGPLRKKIKQFEEYAKPINVNKYLKIIQTIEENK